MNAAGINSYDIIELKRRLNIQTTLSLAYTTYQSGSNKIIEKGYINQKADGDIEKKIINLITGSAGITFIRLIYTTWLDKEPTIKTYRYEHKEPTNQQNQTHNL